MKGEMQSCDFRDAAGSVSLKANEPRKKGELACERRSLQLQLWLSLP